MTVKVRSPLGAVLTVEDEKFWNDLGYKTVDEPKAEKPKASTAKRTTSRDKK